MNLPLPQAQDLTASVPMTWVLTGSLGDGEPVQKVPILSVPFRVGRRIDLHLPLTSPGVSKIHAEILALGDVILLRDLNSTNGTFVNGRRIIEASPLSEGDLVQFADFVFRVSCKPKCDSSTLVMNAAEWAAAITRFSRLIEHGEVVPFYQPVVSLSDASIAGYEVLARSHLEGLERPDEMFRVATQLDVQVQLSEVCRWSGLSHWRDRSGATNLFVNTHPDEDLSTGTLQSLHKLRESFPTQPLTLEIHESAVSNREVIGRLREALDDLQIGLAYDDFGAGQSRLAELINVPPDYLKFDISLMRNIHAASGRQQHLVQTFVNMTKDFGIATLAEGIECEEDAEVCRQLGFDFAQGFHFGRPVPVERIDLGSDTSAEAAEWN